MKFTYLFIFLLFFIIFNLNSCKSKPKYKSINAIYVWDARDSYNFLTDEESRLLLKNNVEKMYCKLTDVVWDEEFHASPSDVHEVPRSNSGLLFNSALITPCIFFENKVMLKSTKEELSYMAKKIAGRIVKDGYKEVQLDCDWSENSKDNYFYFLKTLKVSLDTNAKTSATIRLYQYRYPEKTGVPPVDRGMLMLYNFNQPKKYDHVNAIFDDSEAKKYLNGSKYPLPLDFALPYYYWNILYDAEGKFNSFVLDKDINFFKPNSSINKDSTNYLVKKDFDIHGQFVRNGYRLVIHKIDQKIVKKAYNLIQDLENNNNYHVALFDLNSKTLNYLNKDENIFKTH